MSIIATKELQINEQIRDSEIRLIGVDGEQAGIMSAREAQNLADEMTRQAELMMNGG